MPGGASVGSGDLIDTWAVPASDGLGVSRTVLVDRDSGVVLGQLDLVRRARDRRVCDDANIASNPATCATTGPLVARVEGQPDTGISEVDLAYASMGAASDWWSSVLGRDSVDGAGMTLVATVRYCDSPAAEDCPMQGASWNGSQLVFGVGWAGADDIVAHELTHGIVDRTAGLLPYGESGAIAESIADVFGEMVDQSSTATGPDPLAAEWLVGEQLPGGAIRDIADPTVYGDPDAMTSVHYSPGAADDHGIHTNNGIGNKAVYLMVEGTDAEPGGAFNGQVVSGIGSTKAALVVYQALTTLLTPGSGWAAYGIALSGACDALVGDHGITPTDCVQVDAAVLATRMSEPPVVVGGRLTAARCEPGDVVTGTLFDDDMEDEALPAWTRPVPLTAEARWSSAAGVSTSGTRSLHGPNTADAVEADATLASSIYVPPGTTTYLWFTHSYAMEADLTDPAAYFDGGVVEYTTNNGASWFDAATLPGTINGYPDGATLSTDGDNPLAGRAAYSATSSGFVETRIDLSSVSGQSVKVRFRTATDGVTGWNGWYVDDVSIHTCGTPTAPGAPADAAAVQGFQSATLTWTAPTNDGGSPITGYEVRGFLGLTPLVPIITPDASTTSTVTGLTNGSSYTFTVAAINAIGTGPPSDPTNAVTPNPSPPGQPTAVSAVRGDTVATVSWTAPLADGGAPVTSYVITPYIGATARPSTTTPTAATSFTVTGLTNGTSYTFRVAAVNSFGAGSPSLASGAIVPAGPPGAPTGVVAVAGQLSASLSWTAPSSANGTTITGYLVTAYIGSTARPPVATGSTATSAVITGLEFNQWYTFTVAAVNDVGTGTESFHSESVTPDAQLAAAPTAVTGASGDHQVTLSWTAPTWTGGAPIDSYVVTPYLGGTPLTQRATPTAATSFTVTSLTNGVAYTFKVAAVNAAGTGPASSASAPVVPAGVPDPPTGVAGVSANASVSLSWFAPTADHGAAIDHYVVTPYTGPTALAPTVTEDASTNITVGGLVNGVAYTFRVAAVNSAGTGPPSTASSSVVPLGPPGKPTGLTGTRGDGTASLAWTAPAETGGRPVTHYVITPYVAGQPLTPTITPTSATSFGLSGLTNGVQLTLRVAAVNAVGPGSPSDDVVVLTPAGSPGLPTDLRVLAGNGSVLVSWTPPASDGGAAITAYLVTPFVDGVPLDVREAPGGAVSLVVTGLDPKVAYTFSVTARNETGRGTPSAQTEPVTPDKIGFTAAGPDRVFDTRKGESPTALRQVAKVQVGGDRVLEVKFTDLPGLVPASGVGAVSLNVAVTNTTAAGFVTVYPCGDRKLVASVNYGMAQTVANAVVAPVSASGAVCFYSLVPVDLIVDVNGWFAADSDFAAVGPDRVFDTRPGESPGALRSVTASKVGGEHVLEVQMTDLPGLVPADGVGAVSLNVAVTGAEGPGFVTVYPCGERKLVASVNHLAGQTVANAVIAPLSASGTVCFYSLVPVDLVVDINGWFAAGSDFHAIGPDRVFDTRGESAGALRTVPVARIGGDHVLEIDVLALAGLTPAAGVGAVSMNVAVTNTAGAGFVTVYPCGQRKLVASVNYSTGQTVANAVIAPVSASGTVCFYSYAPADVIVDINGWFPTVD